MIGRIIRAVAGGAATIGNTVSRTWTTVQGSAETRENNRAEALRRAMDMYITELQNPQGPYTFLGRALMDLKNTLNGFVRPSFTLGIVALMVWCVRDPLEFSVAMEALALVPEPLWAISAMAMAFWFGQRPFEKFYEGRGISSSMRNLIEAEFKRRFERRPEQEPRPATARPRPQAKPPAQSDNPAIDAWLRER